MYSNVLEVAYLSDVVEAHDLKIFQVLAQWIFVGLNKFDNHIIENLYVKSYNGDLTHMVEQIKNANLPKDYIVSGLNEKVTRSLKYRKMLDSKHTIQNMFAPEKSKVYEINEKENEEEIDGSFNVELSADNEGTRTNEGIAHCIENEIRALEESKKFPKKFVFKT